MAFKTHRKGEKFSPSLQPMWNLRQVTLVKDPDRSRYHRHSSVKIFWLQPWTVIKKGFTPEWQWHQLLSGSLSYGHLSPVSYRLSARPRTFHLALIAYVLVHTFSITQWMLRNLLTCWRILLFQLYLFWNHVDIVYFMQDGELPQFEIITSQSIY